MKHSPIIQENLDKRETKKEKISYLIYAYKEWVIGGVIALICLFIFAFSMLTNQKADLVVRVISEQPVPANTLNDISDEIERQLDENITIDIQNYLMNSMEQKQVLFAQIAAKEVDLFIVPDSVSEETTTFVDEMIEKNEKFNLNDSLNEFNVYPVINSTRTERIDKLKEISNNK